MYSLSKVCRLMGVTRRTLQGYSEIGLLNPSAKTKGGYWQYDEKALETLALIQIFAEIGYSRSHIKEILSRSDFDLRKEYEKAIEVLQNKKAKIDQMISLLKAYERIYSLPISALEPLPKIDVKQVLRNTSFTELMRKTMEIFSKTGVPNENELRRDIRYGVLLAEITNLNGEDPASPEVQCRIESLLSMAIEEMEAADEDFLTGGNDKIPNDILCFMLAKHISLAENIILEDKEFKEWMNLLWEKESAEFVMRAVAAYCELHLNIAEKYEINLEDLRLENLYA